MPVRGKEFQNASCWCFVGAAARLWRAAATCGGGGQPAGLAAAKTSLFTQKVFDCKMGSYHFEAKAFLMGRRDGRARPTGGRALAAAASALWALAAAQKESFIMGNGISSTLLHSETRGSPSLRRLYKATETAWMNTKLALSMHPYDKPQPLSPSSQKEKGREGIRGMS
jgi:hypothetical protein